MKILLYGINFAPELTGIGKYTGEMAKTGPVASLVTASSLRAQRGNPEPAPHPRWIATAYGLAMTEVNWARIPIIYTGYSLN